MMSMNETASSSHISLRQKFYDRRIPLKEINSTITRRVQRTYEKFIGKPLPPVFKARLDGPPTTWKVFSRLQMATSFADSCTKDCLVFSFEEKIGNAGQRKFLVAHPEQMWQMHRARQLEERCSYEVIRENFPSKLYFDLEFYTFVNSEKNGNTMTEIFINCVIAAMFEQHNLLLKKSDFLWLDASNNSKFSCHLILQMEGVAFQNNIEAGIFVSILITRLRKIIEENTPANGLWPSANEIKMLLVKSKKENEIFFCDEAVYSRNRNFRIYLSTKLGKKSPLVLSVHNEYVPSVPIKCNAEAIFYDSLITYFRNKEIVKLLNSDGIEPKICSQNRVPRIKKIVTNDVSGFASSPFPDVDSFITTKIQDDFAIGFIRKWSYIYNEQKIVYDIGNYRFCSNIGRHHKSNNIKITVNMKTKCYYQTCLDPDCRQEGYRSEAIALPEDIVFVNIPDDFFDADCFTQLQSEDAEIENCNVLNNLSPEYNLFPDCFFDSCDFSQLSKRNTSHGKNVVQSQSQLNHTSWDAFFLESFNTEDSQERNETSITPSLDKNSTRNCDSASNDSTVFLHNISLEEELLMAEAAEVTEVTINGSIFSEETVF